MKIEQSDQIDKGRFDQLIQEETSTVQPSQHLRSLRQKFSAFLSCKPEQVADLVLEEQRESLESTRFLLQRCTGLQEKKRAEHEEAVRIRSQLKIFYDSEQKQLKEKIEQWHSRHKQQGFREEANTQGVKLIEQVKKAEEKRRALLQAYEGLKDPARRMRENETLKAHRDSRQSKYQLLSHQISRINHQYATKIAHIRQRRTEAESEVAACYREARDLWPIIRKREEMGDPVSAQIIQSMTSHSKLQLEEAVRQAAQFSQREEAIVSENYSKLLATFQAIDKSSSQDTPELQIPRINSTRSTPTT